jgi:hypothetical protein
MDGTVAITNVDPFYWSGRGDLNARPPARKARKTHIGVKLPFARGLGMAHRLTEQLGRQQEL